MTKKCIGNKNIISNMFRKLVFDLVTVDTIVLDLLILC